MKWQNRINVHSIFADSDAESHAEVQAIGNRLADALAQYPFMSGFNADMFRNIPQGDGEFGPADYFDRKLDKLYDYCDRNAIWMEL